MSKCDLSEHYLQPNDLGSTLVLAARIPFALQREKRKKKSETSMLTIRYDSSLDNSSHNEKALVLRVSRYRSLIDVISLI